MLKDDNLIPGISLLTRPVTTNLIKEVDGYTCLAVWDWEKKRGKETQIISRFRTKWVVPPPPSKKSEQTIFLFNGLQTSKSNEEIRAILQPVLQWNSREEGSGHFWSVASYCLQAKYKNGERELDFASRTKAIQVQPGDVLTGLMTQENKEDAYRCTCEFEGIDSTTLIVYLPNELVQSGLALEKYNLNGCDEWPSVERTSYEDITLEIAKKHVKPEWSISNEIADCNVRMEVNSKIEDQIDIYYK